MADWQELCRPQLKITRYQQRCECILKHYSAYVRRCTADFVKVVLVVVLRASEDQEAIVQLRCFGLTGTDIYIM